MNKSNSKNSALRNPLDDILGSKGHVMILRELSETEYPMNHSELLDRTSLSKQGVYDVVRRLIERGIVTYVGSGNRQQVALRHQYPLADIIKSLFRAEKNRVDDLIRHLKEEIKSIYLKPKSAWIFGKVAEGTDEYGDPIRITVLGDAKTIDGITDEFRDRIYEADIEKRYDVTINVKGATLADIESKPAINTKDIILLWGPDPQHFLASIKNEKTSKRTHQDLDQQSLIDSRVWTKLLKTHPEIIQRTIKYLDDRISQTSSGEKKELKEWKHILESMSFQRLKKFLQSDSERSARLRQSLPFWPVLKDNERDKLEKITTKQLKIHE